jgi:hypothetical protein
MATIAGNQTISFNSVDETYQKAWSPKYANELKKGNTTIKKAVITRGAATMRASNQVSKGVESHVFSLERDRYRDGEAIADSRLVKVQVVMTCENDDPTEQADLKLLVNSVCAYLPTIMDDVCNDVVD